MKKLIFIIAASALLFSCDEDDDFNCYAIDEQGNTIYTRDGDSIRVHCDYIHLQ